MVLPNSNVANESKLNLQGSISKNARKRLKANIIKKLSIDPGSNQGSSIFFISL